MYRCVCVSPVLCLCSAVTDDGTVVLPSSSLMLVLLESRQITSCLADFASRSDAADEDDEDTCFVTSPGETKSRSGSKSLGCAGVTGQSEIKDSGGVCS